MTTADDRLSRLEQQMHRVMAITGAMQGQPSIATFEVPHNDSWLFEDNIDSTHAADMYYIIPSNTQRIVSARLSLKLLPYRTYNTDAGANTGNTSNNHSHGSAAHAHTIPIDTGTAAANNLGYNGGGVHIATTIGSGGGTAPTNSTTPGSTGINNSDHSHAISVTSTLGVTEGATATGVAIAFDGVDETAALGGPFNADVIELNVRPYLSVSLGAWHLIAMQPSGLGRISAHLRLSYYATAGQVI